MRLHGKVAIVTGSARGIGKAVARRFAAEGAEVVVNCLRNVEMARAVAAEIESAGGRAIACQADVAKRADTERLRDEALEAFGRIDVLVSNAGVIADKAFVDSTDEDWDAAIDTNLRGFFNVCQAVVPHMLERRHGRIIATGSIIVEKADLGGNKFSVCTASKGGVVSMMHPMAAELAASGITVNAVSPGYVATEMLQGVDPAGLEQALAAIPMRRYGQPEEIASAMVFLASDEAAYITGQTLRVNGGMSMS